MINSYQNSIIAQLLEAITGQINFTGTPTSNIGDILLSILEQTPYDKEPKSVLAELFLKLKDKLEGRAFTPYDKEPKSAIAEILLSILNETEYDKEPNSRVAELLLELKAELESYAELTASGAIANFTTSVVKPLVNLTAYFKATQEAGTPTPQSPKAISGVSAVNVTKCSVNLWDEQTLVGGYNLSDGEFNPSLTGRLCSKNMFRVKPNSTVFWHSVENVSTGNVFFYDINKNFISGSTGSGWSVINIPNNCYYMNFTLPTAYGTTYNNDVSLNSDSTDTTYHAYNGSTTLINLGGTYYGGYVTQDKNGKRELVVTHEIIDLGSLNWTYNSSNSRFDASGILDSKAWASNVVSSALCSIYKTVSFNSLYGGEDKTIAFDSRSPRIRDSAYTDATIFKTAVTGQKLVYELAEPFTVALPDGEPITAFNGVNNIYNDSGDTSVTYLAKIEDNLNATAKFRAEVKAQMLKAKEGEKEIIKEDPIEEVKEPIKDSGEVKKGANKA